MPKISRSFPKGRMALALVLALPLLLLSGCCATEKPLVVPEKNEIPSELLKPVPTPNIPDPETMTDIAVGILIQEYDKALETSNAQLRSISTLVKPQS